MENNVIIDRDAMIRVNVPGSNGFYRLRCEAFFTVTKGQFTKMIKALKADTETAEENARILFDFARFMEKECNKYFFRENAERIAEINSVWNAGAECFQLSKAEKAAGKAFQECAAGKKCSIPVLKMPFEYNGIIYASDSFIAARYDGNKNRVPVMYTPEDAERTAKYNDYISTRPNMEKLFPADLDAVKAEYSSVRIPDLPTLKAWKKTAKNADPAVFKAEDGSVFAADYLYKAAALTLSNTLYFSGFGKPAVMTGNGYTVIICGMRVSPQKCNTLFQAVKNTPAPALVKVSFDAFGETVTETMPCVYESENTPENDVSSIEEAEEENNISAGAPAGKECENDSTGAADNAVSETVIPSENAVIPAADIPADNAGIDLSRLNILFLNNYEMLYNTRKYDRAAVNRFDKGLSRREIGILKAFNAFRNDFITSDRECTAFVYALDEIQKETAAADPGNNGSMAETSGNAVSVADPVSVSDTMPETVIPAAIPGNDLSSMPEERSAKLAKDPEPMPEGMPETMPEGMPESMPVVIPTKTAENGAEVVKRYDIHIDMKNAGNGAEMPLKSNAARGYYFRSAETGIPAGIEKMSNCTNYTGYTNTTNYHNMPALPAMYRNDNMHNPQGLHDLMVAGFPSAPSALEKIPFCAGENAFCDILSGVPPGPPGMRVSARWNHPCSA